MNNTNNLNFKIKVLPGTTPLFKNAITPDNMTLALQIANDNHVTIDYINKYFTDLKHNIINIISHPYCFKIVRV